MCSHLVAQCCLTRHFPWTCDNTKEYSGVTFLDTGQDRDKKVQCCLMRLRHVTTLMSAAPSNVPISVKCYNKPRNVALFNVSLSQPSATKRVQRKLIGAKNLIE